MVDKADPYRMAAFLGRVRDGSQAALGSQHQFASVRTTALSGIPGSVDTQPLAPLGDEATLFRLAGQLEQARPWSKRQPATFAT